MTRVQPPVRRPHVTREVEWQGHPFTVTVGIDPKTGAPVDVFADRPKIDGMSATLCDACIVISLAMQCGLSPAELAKSLGRVPVFTGEEGATGPASPLGAIVEAIMAEVLQ